MGNETSTALETDIAVDDAVAFETDSWRIFNAQIESSGEEVSVFKAKDIRDENDLKKFAQNLKRYRHPSILRFVNSCSTKNKSTMVLTERISPLERALKTMPPLQRLLGLYDIATAVEFLHFKGQVCHNNIDRQAIFVTEDRRWKLGGMQFVCRVEEVNQKILEDIRPRRSQAFVAPEKFESASNCHMAGDVFSFGVLADQILSELQNEMAEIPHWDAFLAYVRSHIKAKNPEVRPTMCRLITHSIFNHPLIEMSRFLQNIPLKSWEDRKEFFLELPKKLFDLPEETIAAQMSRNLLSRYVLLDPFANESFIPSFLSPYKGDHRPDFDESVQVNQILSTKLFSQYVTPVIVKVFDVRELEIRKVLLRHFNSFCHSVPKDVLQLEILPQLLLGIKDRNDDIVALTLRALSDLVPILGSQVVVGKRRRTIFKDGTPAKCSLKKTSVDAKNVTENHKGSSETSNSSEVSDIPVRSELPIRQSPIGAEKSDDEQEVKSSDWKDDNEEWLAWDEEDYEVSSVVCDDPHPRSPEPSLKASSDDSFMNMLKGMEPEVKKSEKFPVKFQSRLELAAQNVECEVGGEWDNEDFDWDEKI